MGNTKSKQSNGKNKVSELQKERRQQLNAFRHFVRLNICGAFSIQSITPTWNTSTIAPTNNGTTYNRTNFHASQDIPALDHRDFGVLCTLFDVNVEPSGFPGQWNIKTLENVLDWPSHIVDKVYLWMKLSSKTLDTPKIDLYYKRSDSDVLLFEELFQWLVDLMYPYSILSSIVDETVRQGISLFSTSSILSLPSPKKKYRPSHWSLSSTNDHVSTFTSRKFSLGSYPEFVTKLHSPSSLPMVPFEFIFFLFSRTLQELFDSGSSSQESLTDKPLLSNIQDSHYLSREGFKSMVRWILYIQFVQLPPDLAQLEQYSQQSVLQEVETCHRMVEGILCHSIDNLFLSPIVSIATLESVRPPEPFELYSIITDKANLTHIPVIRFHTWRDWITRNCKKLFDPLYLFLKKTFMESIVPNIVISESGGHTPSPGIWKDVSHTPPTVTPHDSYVSSLVSDDPTLSRPAERIERLRSSSESSSTLKHSAYYPIPLPAVTTSISAEESVDEEPPHSLVLNTALLWLAHHSLPLQYPTKHSPLLVPWELLFSTSKNGFSMMQLKHGCLDYQGPTLMLIQGEFPIADRSGTNMQSYNVVMGACIGSPWKSSSQYWGGDRPCTLYILYPVLEVFPMKTSVDDDLMKRGFSPKNAVYFSIDKGIGFGGSLQGQFRVFIDEYMEHCIFNIHGEDGTYVPSYLPLLHSTREIKEKDKLRTIILPDPLKLHIKSMEIYGLGGKDASESWIRSKTFERQFAEQRKSINVHVKMHDTETDRMLLSLMDVIGMDKYQ